MSSAKWRPLCPGLNVLSKGEMPNKEPKLTEINNATWWHLATVS